MWTLIHKLQFLLSLEAVLRSRGLLTAISLTLAGPFKVKVCFSSKLPSYKYSKGLDGLCESRKLIGRLKTWVTSV